MAAEIVRREKQWSFRFTPHVPLTLFAADYIRAFNKRKRCLDYQLCFELYGVRSKTGDQLKPDLRITRKDVKNFLYSCLNHQPKQSFPIS